MCVIDIVIKNNLSSGTFMPNEKIKTKNLPNDILFLKFKYFLFDDKNIRL